MRINLAKVVPWLVAGVVLLFALAAQGSGDDSTTDDYSYRPYGSDTTRADAYLDRVAVELAQPGVHVDPAVTSISPDEAARLDALARGTDGPVRVLVVPADALRSQDPAQPDAPVYGNEVAYPDDELPGQLYDRVGVDGTYAVLVDAPTSYDGRSFSARQFAEERPFYEVEDALDHAVDCCAPDYGAMVEAFLDEAGREQSNPWPVVGWVLGGTAALVGLWLGGRRLLSRRREKRDDAQVADALRPALQEEVVELSQRVGALPPTPPGSPTGSVTGSTTGSTVSDDVATRTRRVLDLVEEARHRLDAEHGSGRMDTPSEVEDVVRRLDDARYELVAVDALRRGEPVPEKTPPCFFDPRHGPSVATVAFTPEGGAERDVQVCARCRDELAAGQVPVTRTLRIGDLVKPYWQWDRYSRPYVNGYWQRHTFPDQTFQRQRFGSSAPVSRAASRPPLQFVWESGDDGGSAGSWWSSGGSGGSGGGRRFSGSSGRRSSFGGGSSRRSSSRSGGSRRF